MTLLTQKITIDIELIYYRVCCILLGVTLSVLTACNTSSNGSPKGDVASTQASISTVKDFFDQRLAGQMDTCRICHKSGGVADTADGRKLLLDATDKTKDYDLFNQAWVTTGKGTNLNPIVQQNSVASLGHSGGQNWPVNSEAYTDVVKLFECWENNSCNFSGETTSTVVNNRSLLGSSRGGHLWADFCADQADEALLPTDPRRLLTYDVNKNKAVYFNDSWRECRANVDPDYALPVNCGEYRAEVERGRILLTGTGEVGQSSVLSGGGDEFFAENSFAAVDADQFNQAWKGWGYSQRPEDFDEILAERIGSPLPDVRNPYPLPGEDPNQLDGGTGQLPSVYTQLRNKDGSWSGKISGNCGMCHTTRIGDVSDGEGLGIIYGATGTTDLSVFTAGTLEGILDGIDLTDTVVGSLTITQEMVQELSKGFGLSTARGTGNITNIQLFVMLWLIGDSASSHINIQNFFLAPSSGTEDAPQWWNTGHRAVKFYSGLVPMDASRILMQAHMPNAIINDDTELYDWDRVTEWTDANDRAGQLFVESRKSPAWAETLPTIDTSLAEQGAVLFHSKNLWQTSLNNPKPQPEGGNGSCASCHGAYSPRYIHDPDFLDSPVLEGIAAYRVPDEIIDTDPQYWLSNEDPSIIEYMARSFILYPLEEGSIGSCAISKSIFPDASEDELLSPSLEMLEQWKADDSYRGYQAPPLHGVWASAPYFHNGSVPNVWEVLKSSDRKPMWRRVSAPNVSGDTLRVMGFDTNLQRAYDSTKLGWKYDNIICGFEGTLIGEDCIPFFGATLAQIARNIASTVSSWIWHIQEPLDQQELEKRKIYNTYEYSQSNQGHQFTDVLTDQERLAIIEYLKTL